MLPTLGYKTKQKKIYDKSRIVYVEEKNIFTRIQYVPTYAYLQYIFLDYIN